MATKNLARTVVEGGRSGYSKFDRQLRNRSERRLRFDPEGEIVSGKPRRSGGRGFADRLKPLERWLDHHVGRGWSNVYREFCDRFDRRTMKGWHLGDHLLQMVGRGRYAWGWFVVDGRGILRRKPMRRWERPGRTSPCERNRALEWAGGRRVIVHGDALFWTARSVDDDSPASPQGRRLTSGEVEFWASLSGEVRSEVTYTRRRSTVDRKGGAL